MNLSDPLSVERNLCSVVVPVYRNQDTLNSLYQRVSRALRSAHMDYELIFVIDGSPDGSAAVANSIANEDSHVKVLPLEKNLGQARATFHGLEKANGNLVVVMDADLQDEPELIPVLLQRLSQETPIVFAAKRGAYQSWHRRLSGRLFRLCMSAFIDLPCDAGGFVAFTADVKAKLLDMGRPWPLLSAMLGTIDRNKTAIPVERPQRKTGKSAWTSMARLLAAATILSLAADFKLKATFGPSYRFLLALFPIFFAVSLGMSILHGVNKGDEAWILQVARRILSGEVLYRDVFYGAHPARCLACGFFL